MLKIIHKSFLILVICFPFYVQAHKVIGISDGDTMTLLVNNSPIKIRLANIDAPEKKQAFGQKSKESLSEICWNKEATYKVHSIDRYGRTVALVYCNGIEANTKQVNRGMAWVYTKYNTDDDLPNIEAHSRRLKKGLWFDSEPIAPWLFRKLEKIKP